MDSFPLSDGEDTDRSPNTSLRRCVGFFRPFVTLWHEVVGPWGYAGFGPVHAGTAPVATFTYPTRMHFDRTKAIVVALWILAMSVTIVTANLSLLRSTVLVCLAVSPPIVMLQWWKSQRRAMVVAR